MGTTRGIATHRMGAIVADSEECAYHAKTLALRATQARRGFVVGGIAIPACPYFFKECV
jgi:hypothetical protein